jgi:pre-mRNA-splicing factor ATP-dependent RNA helicase DHX38/PRP16
MPDENIHRLEGSGKSSSSGGLIVRKKKAEDQVEFKEPKVSLLGLDKLAAIKEKERRELEAKGETESAKRFKLLDKGSGSSDDRRQFRKYSDETPTHTGGVAREAYEKRKEREKREKERGLLVTSKEGKKDKERDRDRRSDRRDRHDRHEKSRSGHRNRGHDSERHHRGSSRSESTRERDSGWDFDTPRYVNTFEIDISLGVTNVSLFFSRSQRSHDEPATPLLTVKDTPSRTTWEDDDAASFSARSNTWDMPTPYNRRDGVQKHYFCVECSGHLPTMIVFCQDEGYSSRRTGDRYSYSKETPLPTPTFKRNSWNKNNRRDDRSIRKDNTKASNDEGVIK